MKAIFYCAVFCLLLAVSARRELHQAAATGSSSFAFSSTNGTATVATGSSSSATTATTSTTATTATTSDASDDDASEDDVPNFRDGQIDVYFLVDLTVKEPSTLDELQQNAQDIVGDIFGISSDVRIGVGSYVDEDATTDFRKDVVLTDDEERVIDALTGLEYVVGSIGQEGQFFALETVATDEGIDFRPESLNIIIWIGDSPAWHGLEGYSEESAIAALVALGAHVIAIDTETLDIVGEASRIVSETDGLLFKTNDEGLFETVARTVTSDDSSSQASATATASGDVTSVSTSVGDNTATVIGPISLPDAIIEGVLTLIEANS